VRAAVVTVSDGVSAGEREDLSGDLLVELLEAEGFEVERKVVPDEREAIAAAVVEAAREARLVLTTGGTGFASTGSRRGLPRQSGRTRSRGRRTRSSRAASPASAGARSWSTSPARRVGAGTASRSCGRR
jgi:hypothetical protein